MWPVGLRYGESIDCCERPTMTATEMKIFKLDGLDAQLLCCDLKVIVYRECVDLATSVR